MTWVANHGLQISPAMAPYNPLDQEDELRILRDKHYAMHGKIMALTVIATFSLVLFSLILVSYLRRRAVGANSESSDPVSWWSYPLPTLKKRRTGPPETPSRLKDELERSYY